MRNIIKKLPFVIRIYTWFDLFLKAYFPRIHAKFFYFIAYGKRCNLQNPKTLSEKLLWLSLNTYRGNPLVMKLCDKYLAREFVAQKAGAECLNVLFNVYNEIDEIQFDKLPNEFALKISQGCTTNIICKDKRSFEEEQFNRTLKKWKNGQRLYDKIMADVGGISPKELPKYYLCEKYLEESGKKSPTDYKIYCFNGVPRAILVISDRFDNKSGLFMSTKWEVLGELSGVYKKPESVYNRPESLDSMIEIARSLSEGFPFVRIDMYDINGKAIFGEMTFFPSGCIHLQEVLVDGKTMGELLILPS